MNRRFESTRPTTTINANSRGSNRQLTFDPAFSLEVVHLNGIIPGPLKDLTFSQTQYTERIARQEPWYSRCVTDLTCRPAIFIGTTLNESLLWQHMELRKRRNTVGRDLRPTSILVSPDLNSARKEILREYRIEYVEGTAETFAQEVLCQIRPEARRGFAYLGQISSSRGLATLQLVSDLATAHPNLHTEYLLGQEPQWSDILSGRAIERSHDSDLSITANEILTGKKQHTSIFLIGTAGSGKSTALMSLSLSISGKDIPVYWVDRDSPVPISKIRSTILACEGPVMLAIDDADLFGNQLVGLIEDLALQETNYLGVFALRSNKVDRFSESIDASGRVTMIEHVVPHLTDEDIEKLIHVLDKYNRLGKLKGLSIQRRRQAFSRQAGRQLLVAMIAATSGKSHERRAHEELSGLEGVQHFVYSLVCVASSNRHFVKNDEILLASGDKDGDVLLAADRLVARHLLVSPPPTYRIRARHRVIADLVVNKLREDGTLTDILLGLIWAIASKVDRSVRRSDRLWRLVSRLINHDFLIRMVGFHGAREIYERIETLVSFDYHYLLQRGSLEVERGDIRLADQFLCQAQSLSSGDYRVETAYSYMLMRKAWEDPKDVHSRDLLAEGIDRLREVISSRGNVTPYPFHVLGSQALNWARCANLSGQEKRGFLEDILATVNYGVSIHRLHSELQSLASNIHRVILETTIRQISS